MSGPRWPEFWSGLVAAWLALALVPLGAAPVVGRRRSRAPADPRSSERSEATRVGVGRGPSASPRPFRTCSRPARASGRGDGMTTVAVPAATARLSVIVPVYNEKNTLPDLLRRVCRQRLTHGQQAVALEVIVVDDCSNDGGVDFLEGSRGAGRLPRTCA